MLELMAGEIIRSNWYEVEDGSHRGTDGPAPGLTGGKVYCMDSVDLDSRNLYRIHRMTGIKYRVDRPAGGGLASGDEAGSGNTSGDEAESEAAEEDEADADLASDAEGDKLKVVKAESTTEASE